MDYQALVDMTGNSLTAMTCLRAQFGDRSTEELLLFHKLTKHAGNARKQAGYAFMHYKVYGRLPRKVLGMVHADVKIVRVNADRITISYFCRERQSERWFG